MDENQCDGQLITDENRNDIYGVKCSKLERKCQAVQLENERIINHIYQVKKLISKYQKQKQALVVRLEKHKFDFNNMKYPLFYEDDSAPENNKDGGEKLKNTVDTCQSFKSGVTNFKLKKPKAEMKGDSKDSGPLAPKKPINPYLLFCQENRSVIQEKHQQIHGVEMNNHELTKALAQSWHDLSADRKQVYYDRYELEKDRYDNEMRAFTATLASSTDT